MPSERPSRVGLVGVGLPLISAIVVAAVLIVAMVGGALSGVVNPTATKTVAVQSISPAKTGTALATPVSYTHLTLPTNREV